MLITKGKRVLISVLMAVFLLCVTLFGVNLASNNGQVATAAEGASVTFTTDRDAVAKTKTVELSATIHYNGASANGYYWSTIVLNLVPLIDETSNTINKDIIPSLEVSSVAAFVVTDTMTGDTRPLNNNDFGNIVLGNTFNRNTSSNNTCGLQVDISAGKGTVSGNQDIKIVVKIKVLDSLPDTCTNIAFGMYENKRAPHTLAVANKTTDVQTQYKWEGGATGAAGILTQSVKNVEIKDFSDDATIESLKVGFGAIDTAVVNDTVTVPANNTTAMTYACKNGDIEHFVMEIKTPADAGDSTVKVGKSPTSTQALNADGKVSIALDGAAADGITKIYIYVLAEDGVTSKTYTLNVQMWYARFNSLEVRTDFRTNPMSEPVAQNYVALDLVSANDLDTKFTYDVKIPYGPHDADKAGFIYIYSVIKAGYNTSTSVAVSYSSGSGLTGTAPYVAPVAPNPVTNPRNINLANVILPCTVTLKLQPAYLGADQIEYVLNLQEVNTCTELGPEHPDPANPETYDPGIKVIGVSNTDPSKAPEVAGVVDMAQDGTINSIKYTLPTDAGDGFKFDVAIPAGSDVATSDTDTDWDLKITITYKETVGTPPFDTEETRTEVLDPNLDPKKVYKPGDYTVTIESAAGTVKTFPITVEVTKFLQLVLSSQYEFLYEDIIKEDGETYTYRKSYTKLGWTHGEEDVEAGVTTFVLGHILPEVTTIKTFIENIDESQRKMIRLTSVIIENNQKYEEVIYDFNSELKIDSSEYDDIDAYRVGTGWYVDFGTDENNIIERIYLCIIGDVDGDGYVVGNDMTELGNFIKSTDENTSEEDKILKYAQRLAIMFENQGYITGTDLTELGSLVKASDKESSSQVQNYFDYSQI